MRIALVGDYCADVTAHRAIDASFRLAQEFHSALAPEWLHTTAIAPGMSIAAYQGIWCVPASPYANTAGAFSAIHWARSRRVPFLGTCGGFQHALMEIVSAVLHRDVSHAELTPNAQDPLIAPLSCALIEREETVVPLAGTRFAKSYGAARREGYHCSYGLNPSHESLLSDAGITISARGSGGEVRAVELSEHPFFVATLFQPERAALKQELHPLVSAFLNAAAKHTQ